MSKIKKKNISVWAMISRILPQIFSVSPRLFIINYTFFALNGAAFAASTLCMQILFDKVTDFTMSSGAFKDAVLALILLFSVKIFEEIASGFANFIGETYDPRTTGKLTRIVNQKMSKLDPIYFENPELLDHINKSYLGIRYAINFMNTIMDVMLFYVPYFIFMGIYLFKLKPILSISLLFVFIPILFSQLVRAKLFSKLEDDSAPLRRKSKYFENCLVGREYLKETRMLGAHSYFMNLFKESLKHMNRLKWKADIKANSIELSMKIISLIGYMAILWLLFDSLMKGHISVGAFAAVFASIDSMFKMMDEAICGRLGYYAKNFGNIQNYLRFLDLPEREEKQSVQEKLIHGDITLKDVSFSYPFANHNAVENVNLTIQGGETIAIVGENGSGKSTLIRLITGLYIPKSGKVLHNNKATSEVNSRTLFTGVSGVFQKFQRYQLSLSDNIIISEMNNKSKTQEHIEIAAKQGGILLDKDKNNERFPNGYETILSREFEGVDLSGGQWQKVAIARGFYREHEIIVLDEPTAAIDPVEETKIYEQFADIAKNKTAIIVTHRLGSVKFANRIVVMKEGRVVGVGSHDHLLKTCSLYANMWKSQAEYYINRA